MLNGKSCKWCFQLFHWIPLGSRVRKRPRMRFQDQFDQYWYHMKSIARAANLPIRDHWFDVVHDHQQWAKQLPLCLEYHALWFIAFYFLHPFKDRHISTWSHHVDSLLVIDQYLFSLFFSLKFLLSTLPARRGYLRPVMSIAAGSTRLSSSRDVHLWAAAFAKV